MTTPPAEWSALLALRLWIDGVSTEQIARLFGISRNAVHERLNKLGIYLGHPKVKTTRGVVKRARR